MTHLRSVQPVRYSSIKLASIWIDVCRWNDARFRSSSANQVRIPSMSDVKLPELVGSKKNYIILDLKRYEDSLSKMSVRVHR